MAKFLSSNHFAPSLVVPKLGVLKICSDDRWLYSKEIYGTFRSALKFWETVLEDLSSLYYKINPYAWCVYNKTFNLNQSTIGWLIDEFTVTHEQPEVNYELIFWFQEKYRKHSSLKVNRCSLHEYLGIKNDISIEGKVCSTMI